MERDRPSCDERRRTTRRLGYGWASAVVISGMAVISWQSHDTALAVAPAPIYADAVVITLKGGLSSVVNDQVIYLGDSERSSNRLLIGFNNAQPMIALPDSPVSDYGTSDAIYFRKQLFDQVWPQRQKDIQLLADNNIPIDRVWAMPGQFFTDGKLNDNIKNLDTMLAEYAKYQKTKVYLVMQSLDTNNGNADFMDYEAVTNPDRLAKRNDQLATILQHISDNPATRGVVARVDFFNEAAGMLSESYRTNVLAKDRPIDFTPEEFVNSVRSTYETLAPIAHAVGIKLTTSLPSYDKAFDPMLPYTDFYDIHRYTYNPGEPADFDTSSPPEDGKEEIWGEYGVADHMAITQDGEDCDYDPFDPRWKEIASDECQEIFAQAVEHWTELAQEKGVAEVYVHAFGRRGSGVQRIYTIGPQNTPPDVKGYHLTRTFRYVVAKINNCGPLETIPSETEFEQKSFVVACSH